MEDSISAVMRSLLNCIGSGPIQVFFVSYRSPNGRKTIRVIDGFSGPETYSNEHRCTESCCADTGTLEAVSRFKDRDTKLQVSLSRTAVLTASGSQSPPRDVSIVGKKVSRPSKSVPFSTSVIGPVSISDSSRAFRRTCIS